MKVAIVTAIISLFHCCHGGLAVAGPIKNEDVLKSYGGFSHVILKDMYRGRSPSDKGLGSSYFTFGVGYLLAVLHEKLWNLDTRGFNIALKTPYNKISSSYATLLNLVTADEELKLHSTIFTSRENISFSKADALRTNVTFINYNSSAIPEHNEAADQINGHISNQTSNRIVNLPVPHAGWYGDAFGNYTYGVFTNTLLFTSKLASPVRRHFEAEFEVTDSSAVAGDQPRTTKFIETVGYLISEPSADHSAIRLPLENENKSLVLILPNDKTSRFVKYELDEYFKPTAVSQKVNGTVVRVWLPPMTLKLRSQYNVLKKMGITEALCGYDKDLENVIGPIVQYTNFSLSETGDFSVAAVTATHLDNVHGFLDSLHTPEDDESVEGLEETNSTQSNLFKSLRKSNAERERLRDARESMEDSRETMATSSSSSDKHSGGISPSLYNMSEPDLPTNLIKFNTPFFFFLNDNNFGPIFFGSVDSFEQLARTENGKKPAEVVPEGFEWLHEANNYVFWSCP